MKGLTKLSKESKYGKTPLYYSIKKDTVYSEPGEDRFLLTYLINENSPEQIRETVKLFMSY